MNITPNKYYRWYCQLIEHAKNNPHDGYTEKHHIVPRSLGGSNAPDNLVRLSARQHYVAHLCLTKFTRGSERYKMVRAVLGFRRGRAGTAQYEAYLSVRMTGRMYRYLREEHSRYMTHRNLTKNPMSNPATKAKVQEILRVRNKNKNPMSNPFTVLKTQESLRTYYRTRPGTMTGRKQSESAKEKIRAKALTRPRRPHTEETKQKMRDSYARRHPLL